METIRSFIALHLDAALKRELGALQQALHLGSAVRWTKPEQIHLTLKFHGEIPPQSALDLVAALQRGCSNLAPFTLRFDRLGCFPNFKKPRVIWIGLNGDIEALRELNRRVEYESMTLSGHSEDREFVPHLTLGRVKDLHFREMQRIAAALQSTTICVPTSEWHVKRLALMRSELAPKGAIHSEIASIELKG